MDIGSFVDMTFDEYAAYCSACASGRWDGMIVPDDMERFEGLVDPQGNFYSCEYGGHEGKAALLCCAYFDDIRMSYSESAEYLFESGVAECDDDVVRSRSEAMRWVEQHDALTFLIMERGWIATRRLDMLGAGYYLSYNDFDPLWRPTRKQSDTLWALLLKYQDLVTLSEGMEILR